MLHAEVVTQAGDSDLPGGEGRNTVYALLVHTRVGWFRIELGWSGEGGGVERPFRMPFEFEAVTVTAAGVEVRACQEPPCSAKLYAIRSDGAAVER